MFESAWQTAGEASRQSYQIAYTLLRFETAISGSQLSRYGGSSFTRVGTLHTTPSSEWLTKTSRWSRARSPPGSAVWEPV